MKEVTLKIPDKELGFFMELIQQLGFEVSEGPDIPEEHQNVVKARIKTGHPEEMVLWKEARKQFTFDKKS